MRKALLAVTLLCLAGCAGFTAKESPIIEVGERDQVEGCQLLKTFREPAGKWMWGTPYIGNFKNEVIKKAEQMGATHILTRYEIDGIDSTCIVNVYKCPPDHEIFQKKEEDEY